MTKARFLRVVISVAAVISGAHGAVAQDPPDLFLEHLSDYMWIGASGGTWQSAGNWMADTDPVPVEPSLSLGYPNDPNRMDADQVDIVALIGANFSRPLASDLTVNITGGNVTVASVKLGGTTTAVTTSIASASNQLVFENQESNDTISNPGNPMADPPVLPEPIWSFNQGTALIWSTGTAGAGKENRIDADVKLNDNTDVEGDRDLHIYGDIIEGDRLTAAGGAFRPTTLSSLLSGGAKLIIHGNILVNEFDEDSETPGTQERSFVLNSGRGILVPEDPQMPPSDPPTRQGIIDFLGHFVGSGPEAGDAGGWIQIGSPESSRLPLGSVILRGDSIGDDPENPVYDGRIIVNRTNLVLAHNNALGGGDFITGNPNQGLGFNFISDHDSRNIGTEMQIAQWHTVRGASGIPGLEGIGDNSITFSGQVVQTNSRGFINLLPTNKTLTISGPQYPLEGGDNTDDRRTYTIDGSGRTLITGGIHNRDPDGDMNPGLGEFRKRGTGTVVIQFDAANAPDTATDYSGFTYMEGGNLHFATAADLPNPGSPAEIVSTSGGIGLDEALFDAGGAITANGATFLGMLNNSANLNAPDSRAPGGFFRTYGTTQVIYNRYDYGGLMLGAGDYNKNLDFSGSQDSNPLARAANMTLAAHEGGSAYTGTITPAGASNGKSHPGDTFNPTGVPVNPDTYRLGGGIGTLTLPNNNQLVNGPQTRHLLVSNGGEVALLGTHTYSGTTRIQARRETTLEFAAAQDGSQPDPSVGQLQGTTLIRNTTLTVTTLANGGQASSIGNSASDASNLVVQGSTLKYVGSAVITNRLFTVGTAGGTIDASGSGPLTFSSTSPLGIGVAEDRKGYMVSAITGNANNEVVGVPGVIPTGLSEIIPFDTWDLVPGMTIRDTANLAGGPKLVDDDSNLEITGVGSHVVFVGETDLVDSEEDADPMTTPNAWPGYGFAVTDVATFQFGPAPARFLTLGGLNTGNNTLSPLVGDASDINEPNGEGSPGGKGSVGIRKSGAGKWILTNDNTYSGETQVHEGTLLVNGNQSAASGLTTVSDGGTLGGIGTIGGTVLMQQGSTLQTAFSGGTIDPLAILGDLDLSALGNALQVLGSGTGSSWVVASYAGTLTGEFESITAGYSVSYGDGTNDVITLMLGGGVAGDYNGDGIVDAADYTYWRDRLGQNMALPNTDPSDTDGIVTQAEYSFWVSRFGATSGAASGSFEVGAVPEPGSFLLVLVALVGLGGVVRPRRR